MTFQKPAACGLFCVCSAELQIIASSVLEGLADQWPGVVAVAGDREAAVEVEAVRGEAADGGR